MHENLLHMTGICKAYTGRGRERVSVLSDFYLGIRAGEAVGLSGPSGVGKSTVARIIMGIEVPDAGHVFWGDRLVCDAKTRPGREFFRGVQMVWQDPFVYLNPFLSVRSSIVEPMAAFGIGSKRERRERADALMQVMGLDPNLGRCRPGMLSGGQCQRAAIARALSVSPELLICDEALCGLDLPLQVDIMAHLTSVQEKSNMALLFISHDRDCISRMCSRIVYLDRQTIPSFPD
nr:dipeptide/oligopeptide/nickel ABC transporter ATP-binding protein [uncultured Desulfobacter sp.]